MIYEVIVDINSDELDRVFDYSAQFDVAVGQRVLVPFGRQKAEGYVIGKKETSEFTTKDIIRPLDNFVAISEELIELAKMLNRTYCLRLADCVRLFVPGELRSGKARAQQKAYLEINPALGYQNAKNSIPARATRQSRILDLLKENGEYESVLAAIAGHSAIKALLEKDILIRKAIEIYRRPEGEILQKQVRLSPSQTAAIEQINNQKGKFLLHGVTGSGKTEIYLAIIERALKDGKSAIMLVPEIALTPQMLSIFRARFGDGVALLHSGLSAGERYDEWRRLLSGKAKVALGARSAIFAPLKNIGVIIMDEEHDSSYVSTSNPRYITKDIAEYRAAYNGANLILGSATPSLDTYKEALDKNYTLIRLKERVNRKILPHMEIIDMRREIREGNMGIFSQTLLSALKQTFDNKEQAMLFINRRGYASFLRCRACGYVSKCPGCDVSLTYHYDDKLLKCHYCGRKFYLIDKCPLCGGSLKEGHMGTERVAEELAALFPEIRVLRMDNDTTLTKNSYREILDTFRKEKADALVGTQMIAKGHDFDNVTLVGILDADLSLYFSDYRSVERTFQLITQVAGRAGRGQKEGRVIVQTYNPNHYVFRYAGIYNYEGFYEKESSVRKATKFPPYSKIIRILLYGEEQKDTLLATQSLYRQLRSLAQANEGISRLQAMPAPIKRIDNKHRYQIVMFLENDKERLTPLVFSEVKNFSKKGVSIFAEVNPQQMM
jgi:primosomal protein N' (replication factor Y)